MSTTTLTPSQSTYLNLLSIWGVVLPEYPNANYKIEKGVLHVKKDFNMLEAIRNAHVKNCVSFATNCSDPTEETFTIHAVHTPILAYLAYKGVKELPSSSSAKDKCLFVKAADAVDLALALDRLEVEHLWTKHSNSFDKFEFTSYEEKGNLYIPTNVYAMQETSEPIIGGMMPKENFTRTVSEQIKAQTNFTSDFDTPLSKTLHEKQQEARRNQEVTIKVTDKFSKSINEIQAELDAEVEAKLKYKKPTAYLSGGITGKSVEEYTRAFLGYQQLLANAYGVINPVILCGHLDGKDSTWADYMEVCTRELYNFKGNPEAITVFMLPDWQESKGACIEHSIATTLGFKVIYLA